MAKRTTTKHPIGKILLVLLMGFIVVCSVFSYFGGFNTGKCANKEEFAKYAGDVSDITVPDGSSLQQQLADYTWMGDVGEGYSPLMLFMPMSYRDWVSPAELYDGVIFVTKAKPIEVIGKRQ